MDQKRIYISANYIYVISETGNEAQPLVVTRPYKRAAYNRWEPTGMKVFRDAGMFIKQQGGVEALLAKSKWVDDLNAWVEDANAKAKVEHDKAHAVAMEREAERKAERKAEYERLFSGEVTEANEETVGALLRYLNTKNWGGWDLPKMTIGYACHQYDCDGKIATTIKLDKPIMVADELGTMFQVGAPHGHLSKYRRI